MHRAGGVLPLIAVLVVGHAVRGSQQSPAAPDVVAGVRAAMATGGVVAGEKALHSHRAIHGSTPATVDALLWLARGALSARLFDSANKYAAEGRDLALALLATTSVGDAEIEKKVAGSLEILALVLVGQDARSNALHLLRTGLNTYRETAAADGIRNAIQVVSLEGRPAPRLERGVRIGSRLTPLNHSDGPTLVFFWAHWCVECKAEAPMLEKLVEKYRSRGLAMVAPTRRYGTGEDGRPTSPDKELQHIVRVRDTFYPFLKRAPVPVTAVNYKAFGVSAVPVLILADREGIVRLHHAGRIAEAELEAAIVSLLPK